MTDDDSPDEMERQATQLLHAVLLAPDASDEIIFAFVRVCIRDREARAGHLRVVALHARIDALIAIAESN